MHSNTLAIPIAFILLAGVLCLLLIGSKWKWWQKLALIVIVPSFGLAIWRSIDTYKGWPAAVSTPEKSLLLWGEIREPNPARDDAGAIYLWLVPMGEKESSPNPLDYASSGSEPRAYKLPYSRPLHNAVEQAKGMIREGRAVVLDRSGKGGSGNGEGEGGGSGNGSGEGSDRPGYGYDDARNDFQVYELPPPHPPRKMPE